MHAFLRRIEARWARRRLPSPALPRDFMPVRVGDIALPRVASPVVTIVIPVYGHLEVTLRCLASVAAARSRTPFEVVLVDDGSPAGTLSALSEVRGLRSVRLEENLGFVGAANRGASEARGEWLCFLNNDVLVTDDWLDALVETPAAWSDCGVVGACLLQADGFVQEAGGIVWSDGSATHYGRSEHPDRPEVGFPRPVDYCSGACLLVGRRWFVDAGGFSEAFAPGYYEDVDLAFRLREQRGLEVYYQPRARVFHFEGTTAGTDLTAGVKRYQSIHRDTLRRRWASALDDQPPRGTPLSTARTRNQLGRCLVVDAALPAPDRDAGSHRLVQCLRALRGMKLGVACGGLGLDGDPERVAGLERLGVETLRRPFTRSWKSYLRSTGPALESVVLCRLGVFDRLAPLVRRHAPGARLVFDTVDLRGRRERRRAEHEGDAALRRRAAASERAEAIALRQADVVLAVSELEADEIAAVAPETQCVVVPDFYPPRRGPAFEERRDLLFVGGFRHGPNLDAVRWLLDELWPRLEERLPREARLLVVGEEPPEEIRRHHGPRVRVLGAVADLEAVLDRARLTVAPLRWGAGLKGKVQASLAAGVPCVGTPIAAEGLGVEPGVHMAVVEGADAFVREVVERYGAAARWSAMSEAGRELTIDRYPWSRLEEALSSAVGPSARHRK